jgi:uncharacterized membrane protein YqjE
MEDSPDTAAPGARSGGLFASARHMLATALAIAHNRLELITTEIEEELYRVAEILVWAFLAIFFGGLTVLMAAFLVVLLWWDEHRLLAASLTVLVFLAVTLAAVFLALHKARARPKLLHATIEELRRDRDALEGRS